MKLARILLAALTATAAVAAGGRALEINLPPEKTRLDASPLPGYALAQGLCATCHSAEYVQYQPRTSGRAYWQATVVKMQKTFAAPIPDDAIPPLVDYLVKTYGAERPGADSASAPAKSAAPAKKK